MPPSVPHSGVASVDSPPEEGLLAQPGSLAARRQRLAFESRGPNGVPASVRSDAYLLFLAAVLVRLVALWISDNEDGDAFARLLWGRGLVDQGDWLPTKVWLPGHFAFLALPYAVGLKGEIWAVMLTALASAAAIPLTYLIARQSLDRSAAVLAGVLLALLPLHVRFSVVTVAEGPYWTLALVGIWACVKYVVDGRVSLLVIGAAAFNLAGTMRFDAWVLPAFLAIALAGDLWMRRPADAGWAAVRRIVAFVAFSSVFSVLWTGYSWWKFGDPFAFQHSTVAENALFFAEHPPRTAYILAFLPAIVLATLGPLGAAVAVLGMVRCFATKQAIVPALFLAISTLFLVAQQLSHHLITQARYGFVACALLVIFSGPGCESISALTKRLVPLGVLRTALLVSAIVWPILIALAADAPLGWLSAKAYSVSPRPRFDPAMVDIDRWLSSHDARAGAILVVGAHEDSAGPWLSLLDRWFDRQHADVYVDHARDRRQLYFLRPGQPLVSRAMDEPRAHLVIPAKLADAIVALPEFRGVTRLPSVYGNARYSVYRWGFATDR